MNKTLISGLLALAAGVGGLQLYAAKLEREAIGGVPVEVLVLREDLGAGATLTREALAVAEIPEGYVESRRLRADRAEDIIGETLQIALSAGDGLLETDLRGTPPPAHLAAVVTPGRRAYSLREQANPFDRLLEVGDHVDVLLLDGGQAETLLEDVEVLAVGGRLANDAERPQPRQGGGVTLSVTRLQSAKLLAAEARGSLRLVLRHPDDDLRNEGEQASPRETSPPSQRIPRTPREIEHVR